MTRKKTDEKRHQNWKINGSSSSKMADGNPDDNAKKTKTNTKSDTKKEEQNNNSTDYENENQRFELGTFEQEEALRNDTREDEMDTNSLLDDDILNTSSDTMKQITEDMENLLEEVRHFKPENYELRSNAENFAMYPDTENFAMYPNTTQESNMPKEINETRESNVNETRENNEKGMTEVERTEYLTSNKIGHNTASKNDTTLNTFVKPSTSNQTLFNPQEDDSIRRSARQMKRSTPDYTRLAKGQSPAKKQKQKSKAPDNKERIKELKKQIETKDQLIKLNNESLNELNEKIHESTLKLREEHNRMTDQKLENENLKDTIRRLDKELQTYKESNTKRDHHPDQAKRINELKKLNTVLSEQIEVLKQQNNTLTETNTDLLDQNRKLRETKGGHEKMEQEISTLKMENEQMKCQLEHNERQLKQQDRAQEQLIAEHKGLQERYSAEMNNLEKLTAKLKTENTEKQKKIEELTTANEEYQEFNDEMKQLNTAQEALLQTLKEEKKRLQEQATTRKPPSPKLEPIIQIRPLEARPTYAAQAYETQNQDKQKTKKRPTRTDDTETRMTPKRPRTTPDTDSEDNVQVTIKHISQDERSKILLITDVSSNRLIQQLKGTTRDKIYTQLTTDTDIDSLERATRNPDIVKKIHEADQVVILWGIKDIKRGMDGKDLCKRLDNLTRDLGRATLTQIRLCQLPPTSINEKIRTETNQFNQTLKNRTNYYIDTERIWTLKLNQALEENGYSLTDLGMERLAKDIDAQALPGNISATQKKTMKQLRKNEIPFIIGRDGSKIKQLQRNYRVQMTVRQHDNENNGTLLIKGTKENTEKALEEVKYILHATYERTSRDSSPN